MKIAIIGLEYVGLPLSVQFARSGVVVLGLDIDQQKVDSLNAGKSYIQHIGNETIQSILDSGHFSASTDFSEVSKLDVSIICVPTPLGNNREPDISYVLQTAHSVAPHIAQGSLIVLESTTYPGTTDTELRLALEADSGMQAGKDFHLAFSPEREDPGNSNSVVATIPKVIGGHTPTYLEKANELYMQALKSLVPVSSCRAAEATNHASLNYNELAA